MAGCRKQPNSKGLYQGWFINEHGEQKFFLGSTSRKDTLSMAIELETKARKIRMGLMEPTRPWEKSRLMPIEEAVDMYFSWGESQGGRGGRPWAREHVRMKRQRLDWWVGALKLETLSDLDIGILARAEKALQGIQKGAAGKTLIHYREALSSFCQWLVDRSLIETNPVARLGTFDKTPKSRRRLLTDEEVGRILQVAPPDRALVYRLMLATGLRIGEVQRLKVENLNPDLRALCLSPDQTKNKKPATIFIPPWLQEALQAEAQDKGPGEPLLSWKGRLLYHFDRDCKAAEVVKANPTGKIDLHALRVKFISSVVEGGATIREVMDAARHSTADMSLGVYAKSRHERLRDLADSVGKKVEPKAGNVPTMLAPGKRGRGKP